MTYQVRSLHPFQIDDIGVNPARGQGSKIIEQRFMLWLRNLLGDHYYDLDYYARDLGSEWPATDHIVTEGLRRVLGKFDVIKKDFSSEMPCEFIDLPSPLQNLCIDRVDFGQITLGHADIARFCYPALYEICEAINSQIHQIEDKGLVTKVRVSPKSRQC